jgi:hypothetical protein
MAQVVDGAQVRAHLVAARAKGLYHREIPVATDVEDLLAADAFGCQDAIAGHLRRAWDVGRHHRGVPRRTPVGGATHRAGTGSDARSMPAPVSPGRRIVSSPRRIFSCKVKIA